MSQLVSWPLETLETVEVQEIRLLKYIVTIPHDWLVKRIFTYIIKKELFMRMPAGFARDGQKERP